MKLSLGPIQYFWERERVFDFKGEPRLNLITCTGDWDAKSKSYDERVVVYALYVE